MDKTEVGKVLLTSTQNGSSNIAPKLSF